MEKPYTALNLMNDIWNKMYLLGLVGNTNADELFPLIEKYKKITLFKPRPIEIFWRDYLRHLLKIQPSLEFNCAYRHIRMLKVNFHRLNKGKKVIWVL